MRGNIKLLRIFLLCIFFTLVGFTAVIMVNDFRSGQVQSGRVITGSEVLGIFSKVVSPISDDSLPRKSTEPASVTATPATYRAAPAPAEYSVTLVDVTPEIPEGGQVTFSWNVDGSPRIIHTSAVYFGTVSNVGVLPKTIAPAETHYTETQKDFLDGNFTIPLRFVGNVRLGASGTYYARAYALIDGKHYWSEERSFVVKPIPKNEIRLINYPKSVKAGENNSFTWEVIGPSATTGFTAIVGGKASKPGTLSDTVDIPQTPYTVFTRDFVSGTYNVPLRFIGNARFSDTGTYYFRALAFINGKNIWSDEYSFAVE